MSSRSSSIRPSTVAERNASRPHDLDALPPATTKATAPFDSDTADVILRSSDLVDFRVHKGVLLASSPIFVDMFSLPQPSESRKRKERDDADYVDGVPVVVMTEKSEMLRLFLLFCYPAHNPVVTLQQTVDLMGIAEKFEVEFLREHLQAEFKTKALESPFEAYALAHRRNLREQVKAAARASLAQPMDTAMTGLPSSLHNVPLGDIVKLQQYRVACAKAAQDVITPWKPGDYKIDWMAGDGGWVWHSPQCPRRKTPVKCGGKIPGTYMASDWFIQGVSGLLAALQERPCGATVSTPEAIGGFAGLGLKCCTICVPNAYSHGTLFTGHLARRVEDAVDQASYSQFLPRFTR